MSSLNGFTLQAVGTLARNPELVAKENATFVRFCLVGNNYNIDDNGVERPVASTVWFHAFDEVANSLIKHARKGDQLIVEALVCGSTVVQEYYAMQQVQFIVTAFEFGARARNGGNASSARAVNPPPPNPTDGATEETAIAVTS
jgi:single-stranded DNA-binding protein